MNKIEKTILIILIAVFSAGILFVPSTNAQADELVVEYWTGTEWQPLQDPIFSETDFKPGDSVSRRIKVTNNSGQPQRIVTRVLNVNDLNNLGDAFNLEIKEGPTIHYSNTLSNFFDGGEIYLSDLTTGNNAQYDFTISFDSSAGDIYQDKSLGFDILIGFQGSAGGMPPGWGTGAGGPLPPGLTIKYEKDFYITTTTATIIWDTSYDATSQVIYDTIPGKFNLNPVTGGGPPNYGYAFSKEEDDIFGSGKGKNHQVTLTGLLSGITYYYRAVSHGSLAISQEHSFTTLGVKGEIEQIEEMPFQEKTFIPTKAEETSLVFSPGEGISESTVSPAEKGSEKEGLIKESEQVEEGALTEEQPGQETFSEKRLLAAIGVLPFTLKVILIIVGVIIIGIVTLWLSKKRKIKI